LSNRETVSARSICGLVVLLLLATAGDAAEVAYQHPVLTIVAKDEPLDSVLRVLGREMRIYIKVPTGLNPVVNCSIHDQSVTQALKTLLGDLSYSLEWESGGERLVGLTILSSGGESAVTAVSERIEVVNQPELPVVTEIGNQGAGAPIAAANPHIPGSDHDYTMAQHEARMAREREAHEAEMAQRRQEEEIAQEARMKEEMERHDAEMRAYIEAQGLKFPD
jgi:hypothetical protein